MSMDASSGRQFSSSNWSSSAPILIVKSWLVWHRRKTFVPNAIHPKNFALVNLGLLAAKVLKGTSFFAWWIWLMTWWSAMVLKDFSALCISHNKDFQWWVGSWSMNEGWSWTFWLFLDTWGPTLAKISQDTFLVAPTERWMEIFTGSKCRVYVIETTMSNAVEWGIAG
jgi:hypothetical protein